MIYLSKNELYRDQVNISSAKTHSILPSTTASTGVNVVSYPMHILSIPIANATGDIDIAVNGAQFQILSMYTIKNANAAGVGDTIEVKHVAQDGTTVTSVGAYTTVTFLAGAGAANRTAHVPNMPNSSKVFSDRCKIRVSSNSATDCGCTLYMYIGLV